MLLVPIFVRGKLKLFFINCGFGRAVQSGFGSIDTLLTPISLVMAGRWSKMFPPSTSTQ